MPGDIVWDRNKRTQGNPTSLIIFNIVVDMVVQVLLEVVCSPHKSQHGRLLATEEINLIYYVDDGRIFVRDHE